MHRVIVLGASNVTIGFPLIAEGLRNSLPGPVELFAAHGHGRSYGLRSRVLLRRLPGIRDCGLWGELDRIASVKLQPLALITDVGNDLLFGVRPEMLLSWVAECMQRLRAHNAAVTVTGLPLESISRMSLVRYRATRAVFFPGCGVDWESMKRMAAEVDAGLRELAEQHGCRVVTPRGEWYGFDPIHVRRRSRVAAWSNVFSTWPGLEAVAIDRQPLMRGIRYWRLEPAERELWGRRRLAAQPVWRDADGTAIWLY